MKLAPSFLFIPHALSFAPNFTDGFAGTAQSNGQPYERQLHCPRILMPASFCNNTDAKA